MLSRKEEKHYDKGEKEFEYVRTDTEELYLTTYRCKLNKTNQVCFKTADTLVDYPLLDGDFINIKTEIDYKSDNDNYSFMFTFVIELDNEDDKEDDKEEDN